jgi:hypothetical protein
MSTSCNAASCVRKKQFVPTRSAQWVCRTFLRCAALKARQSRARRGARRLPAGTRPAAVRQLARQLLPAPLAAWDWCKKLRVTHHHAGCSTSDTAV